MKRFFFKSFVVLSFNFIFAIEHNPFPQEINDSSKYSIEQKKESEETYSTQGIKEKTEQEVPKPEKLLKIGNLAFPSSQQPTPLISFGQNLIGAKNFQLQEVLNNSQGDRHYFIDLQNSLIYGVSDSLGALITVPNAIRFRIDHHHSSGPEDFLFQMEYACYTQEDYTYYNQATIVGNVTIPTGSIKKNPPTGCGSNSFFIGTTYSRLAIDWLYFTSYGGMFYGSSHKTQLGNQFLYQVGIGKRIFSNVQWLFDWMLEITGTYSCKNKIEGKINSDSGGNIIYVTPSIFLASKDNIVIQMGLGFPIIQQLNGYQKKEDYLFQTKISWTF